MNGELKRFTKIDNPILGVAIWKPFFHGLEFTQTRLSKEQLTLPQTCIDLFNDEDFKNVKEALAGADDPTHLSGSLSEVFAEKISKAFTDTINLLRQKDSQTISHPSKIRSDAATEWCEGKYSTPSYFHIDIVTNTDAHITSRIELIAAYQKRFPDIPIYISIFSMFMHQFLKRLTQRNISADKIYFIGIPNILWEPTSLPWPGDAFSMIIQDEEPAICISNNTPYSHLVAASLCEKPLPLYEQGMNFLQFGNLLPIARSMSLAGISVWAYNQDTSSLSSILGRDIVYVGDRSYGEALFHIDLYLRPLPNGTVLVADFRRGLEVLRDLDPDQIDELIQTYLADYEKETFQYDVFFKEFFNELKKGRDQFLRALHSYTELIARKIDSEIETLKAQGIHCAPITAYPVFSFAGGLTHLNSEIFCDESGKTVLFCPSFGKKFDQNFEHEVVSAGYSGDIFFIPGQTQSLIKSSGGIHCSTFEGFNRPKNLLTATGILKLWQQIESPSSVAISISKEFSLFETQHPELPEDLVIEAIFIHKTYERAFGLIPQISDRNMIDPQYRKKLISIAQEKKRLAEQVFELHFMFEYLAADKLHKQQYPPTSKDSNFVRGPTWES